MESVNIQVQEYWKLITVEDENTFHSWRKRSDGSIDDLAYEIDYHSGPSCSVCYECFCIDCDSERWKNIQANAEGGCLKEIGRQKIVKLIYPEEYYEK